MIFEKYLMQVVRKAALDLISLIIKNGGVSILDFKNSSYAIFIKADFLSILTLRKGAVSIW